MEGTFTLKLQCGMRVTVCWHAATSPHTDAARPSAIEFVVAAAAQRGRGVDVAAG